LRFVGELDDVDSVVVVTSFVGAVRPSWNSSCSESQQDGVDGNVGKVDELSLEERLRQQLSPFGSH
jgi:hypothetical protein